jgi:hypothetical protein
MSRTVCFLIWSAALAWLSAWRSEPERNTRPTIEAVENGGLLFTDNTAGVSGVDAGYSIPIGKQTLWLFGDVFLLDPRNPAKPYVGALSNCGLLVPAGTGVNPLKRYRFLMDQTGKARELLTAETGDQRVRHWLFGGWHDARRRQVYLYYARVRTTGQGPLDFTTEGFGLAAADSTSPDRIQFRRIQGSNTEELWWKAGSGPVFGSAVHESGGFLYVVGHKRVNKRIVGALARVRPESVADRRAYEYFAGGDPPTWSYVPADSAAVQGLWDFPTEVSLFYNRYLGRYLAVHSVGISQQIRISASERPWGPFEQIGEIGSPKRALSRGFTYAGKEHPELSEGGGRVIYVTYVDSERYWLQLLKITLRH